MFCPKCAAQNTDDAKYCRACGADISLVPQVLTGHLAERLAAEDEKGGRPRHKKESASLENAARQFFMGIGFAVVALALAMSRMGRGWWFWMLIPAFIFIGNGVGMYLRAREERKKVESAFAPVQPVLSNPPRASELPPRRHTGELVQPPASVTEATTRHLGMPVERKPKDV